MEFVVNITISTNVLFSDGIEASLQDAIDNALGCGLQGLIEDGEYSLVSVEAEALV